MDVFHECLLVCRKSQAAYSQLEPLLKALQVLCLSAAVQQSVLPNAGWTGCVELDPITADCILTLQKYLVHRSAEVYQQLDLDSITNVI